MTTPKTTNIDDANELDGLLSGLDVNTDTSDEGVDDLILAVDEAMNNDPIIEEGLDELELDELRSVEAQITREANYATQESTVDAVTTPRKKGEKAAKSEKAPKAAKEPKPAKEKAEAAPRVVRDLASLPATLFVLEGTAPKDEAELEKIKADTIALSPSQKKIAEKFENLFASLHAGRMPSTFITQAFSLLEMSGSTSSTEIVAAFKTKGAKNDSEGYNEGTARSQAGQIMHLFEVVKIASRHKQALQLNKNSNVAAMLRKIIEDSSKTTA